MPPRRSSRKSQITGSGALLFLLIVGAALLYNAWQERNDKASTSEPTIPALTLPASVSGEEVTAAPAATEDTSGNPVAEETAPPAQVQAGDAITVWFTDPLSGKTTGGIENNLVAAIDGAKKSVDMAIYNLSLDNVGNALIKAKKRGITVRLVMESEAIDKKVPQSLKDVKIPIVGDEREGLMHNKFTIIDGQEVWMGSMNYTSTSAYKDFNNLVRFRNPQLVADYQAAFDEMFTKHLFGSDKKPNTPNPKVTVNGVPVEVYYSPDDDVESHVLPELTKAKKSIVILAYSFTSDPFAKAIQQRAAAGVKVRGVFDESQNESNTGGEFATFKKAKYDVKLDGIPGLLHDKVFIIDGQVVITGSYNFSQNAEKTNDENLVIIRDPGIAAQYLKHFEAVYNSAK